jgi:hypothetical protein
MSTRRIAFASFVFSGLVIGTIGCVGPVNDDNPSTFPDSGSPGVPDAKTDVSSASIPDAWIAPDSLAGATPDSLPAMPDSTLALKPDVTLPPPDSLLVANPDSPLDVGIFANPDAPVRSPDTALTASPDTSLGTPDIAIDSAPATPDATTAPADAAAQFGKTVTFSNGRAVGAMIDWGWVSGGNSQQGGGNAETPLTTFTQPVCPAGAGALTGFSQSCSDTRWPTANALCMSGNIPSVTACSGGLATVATTAGPVTAQCEPDETMDYGENWGAMVGVQARPEKKSTITFAPASIAVTFSGAPTTSNIRLMIVIDSISYCTYGTGTSYISGTALTAADFSNQCWTSGGVAPASLAGIQKVMLQIDSRTAPVEFTNFCFTGIVFE